MSAWTDVEPPEVAPTRIAIRPRPGRWRLVAGAVLAPPCWFLAFIAGGLANDAYTNCGIDCEYPNHRAGLVDGVFVVLLALLPVAVAGLFRRSPRWQLVGVVLVLLSLAMTALIVTKSPPS